MVISGSSSSPGSRALPGSFGCGEVLEIPSTALLSSCSEISRQIILAKNATMIEVVKGMTTYPVWGVVHGESIPQFNLEEFFLFSFV